MKVNKQQLTGEVLSIYYRSTSMYGNCSYWVIIRDEYNNYLLCHTRPNSQLAFIIHNLRGKTVTFDATYKKHDRIELNNLNSKRL